MAFPILSKTKKHFNKVKKIFENANVEIRPIVAGNMAKQPFFTKNVKNQNFNLENSDIVHDFGLYFPNNPELNDEDMDILINLVKLI